jgi:hypothetical protein
MKGVLMEALNVLESRIASLLNLVAELKVENVRLVEESLRYKEHIDLLEHSLLKNHQSLEEIQQEKALTKLVVDDLIKNIDSLVKTETQV